MTNKPGKGKSTSGEPDAVQSEVVLDTSSANETAAQVKLVLESILQDHPHLRVARDSLRESAAPAKYSNEFLQKFRKRLCS